MQIKKRWLIILSFALVLLAGVCVIIKSREIHLVGGIPQKSIVFRKPDSGALGFINPDGSGYEEREIGRISYVVTWGGGGNYLNLRLAPPYASSGGFPFLISNDGSVYYCKVLEEEANYYTHFRSIDNFLALLVVKQTAPESERVVFFNMKTCQEERTLYIAQNKEILQEVMLSNQNYLAIRKSDSAKRAGISILGPDQTELKFILDAQMPAWSKDGEWLAYSQYSDVDNQEYLTISKKDGTGQKSLNVRITNTPSWSPDGDWIVYESDGEIDKISVKTGEVVKLFENGRSPDWRWDVPVN